MMDANLCDLVVSCQMVVNIYQMHPVIKHYATPNHDALCWTDLTHGEMGWLVAFSGSLSYESTDVIPEQTETKFIRELHPMPFDGSSTMMMTPRQTFSPVFSGQW
ncbi:hypothetical protein TNCV_4243731 [Trichonephila clavipes]|nr:hypothetical protein TNCV_4243731 [Trichonephila clavipes]